MRISTTRSTARRIIPQSATRSRNYSAGTAATRCTRFSISAVEREGSHGCSRNAGDTPGSTGVDRSEAMLELARAKKGSAAARPDRPAPKFLAGDLRTLQLGERFDAVLMMFAVLGYQTTDADVSAAMRTVASHLRPGGVFICDVWFWSCRSPRVRSERIRTGSKKSSTRQTGSFTAHRQGRSIRYAISAACSSRHGAVNDGRISDEVHGGTHDALFLPAGARAIFAAADLRSCVLRPFDDLDAVPSPSTWNVWACGRSPDKACRHR